jgi:hypothetical protein
LLLKQRLRLQVLAEVTMVEIDIVFGAGSCIVMLWVGDGMQNICWVIPGINDSLVTYRCIFCPALGSKALKSIR